MPLDASIKKVLVIGSGPIVIGQAAEFDYAGTQACRVLKEEGIEIVLVNSNPATIMTDENIADKVYIEPLTLTTIKRIIEKEHPDSILSGLGGQTGLTRCMQLAKEGFLEKMNIRLLGSLPDTIDKAEDRKMFKDTMLSISQPCIPSEIATSVSDAADIASKIGYPVIIRPAFTLGGVGGGIASDEAELRRITGSGLKNSPIGQVLVEKSVAGWKEIEFEVMRDKNDNAVIICSMENFDPVGVHTGDSIVVAPCVTLADKEYQMLRTASLDIVRALGVQGGCNVQFALNPGSFEYAVIEVNPRVSRSSALASKATGYPIAKVSTKIAIGYTLDEILNAVTGTTYAAFEPALDYIAVKLPKWPFDKFVYGSRELGTQMKATGEVMAIADTFEEAILKAVRGAELGMTTLESGRLSLMTDGEISKLLETVTDERLFVLYEAIRRGFGVDVLHERTKVDRWFLYALKNIADNSQLSTLNSQLIYKMVDTCAAEFQAQTPYFYSLISQSPQTGSLSSKGSLSVKGLENEAPEFVAKSTKERIVVLGSGPIRIGQGIEFDYACVHCVWTLMELGYEVVVINNNPETVSTDFDTADRLYFEPLHIDDVMGIIEVEKPIGVIVSYGGGTAIKLTGKLHERGISIIGTSAESIDACENREHFNTLLEKLNIKRPDGYGVLTEAEALEAAEKLGFPVLMRPSNVLGGHNMIIAHSRDDICEYMEVILRSRQINPVLIDKYLEGREIEIDAIFDGEDIFIPGIMEHVERTGVHSGDSIAIYPAAGINDELASIILDVTRKLCAALKIKGLVNIQYVYFENDLYVIEVNPRASRTVPYISKVTGIPMCGLSTKVAVGMKLGELGYTSGFGRIPPYVAAKVPVFSFEKLPGVDTHLGPEMKSTGEVLGIGKNLKEALFKGLVAAGYTMEKKGGVLITVRDIDKPEISDVAEKLLRCGFELYATKGTAGYLSKKGYKVNAVDKIHQNPDENTETLLESGRISYVINTSTKGRDPAYDDVKLRRKACSLGIPCLTSIDTVNALTEILLSGYSEINTELVDITDLRSERQRLPFTKMHGCGNDYIYINCFDMEINSPESLSVFLSDRHTGIGGDGVILIMRSETADAKMRMFNLDGSEGLMCGNGIRCVGKYLFDNGIVRKQQMSIETKSGIRELFLSTRDGKVSSVRVDMGRAILAPSDIPVRLDGDSVIARNVSIGGREYEITCVSMGNPHVDVFCGSVELLDLETIGPQFEHDALFPDRVNAGFIEVTGRNRLKVRIWERGSGETRACGTGACAAAVASVLNGHCDKGEDIRVQVLGGELVINYTDEAVMMTGDAVTVYNGVVEV